VDLTGSGSDLMAKLLRPLVVKVAELVARLHLANIIHGDITTSNILISNLKESSFPNPKSLKTPKSVHDFLKNLNLTFIDFGLSKTEEKKPEERSVDLYVLERAWVSTHPTTGNCLADLWGTYFGEMGEAGGLIEKKLKEVRMRGRKRSMLG